MNTMIRYALVRPPGPDAADGLTEQNGPPVRMKDLRQQHAAYCNLLQKIGIELIQLDPLPGFPDAYFVEDTAVVTPEIAVITRPGAPQRRGEEKSVARRLADYRPLKGIEPPGTLDGGDVLIVEQDVFVGLSRRTNCHGADQLGQLLAPFGYRCIPVEVPDGLHLKSSVASLDQCQLLLKDSWSQLSVFDDYAKLLVDSSEDYACNTLAINGHLIMPMGYPRTRALLESVGKPIHELDTHPFRRMDGGLTCLSLRF
jgi:dimethylargininase